MASTPSQTAAPSSQTPVAKQAADLLWKFQLRREHDQLIANLNAHQEQLSTFVSDTHKNCQKIYARLDAVENKVDKLEAEGKKLSRESRLIHNELQVLKEGVRSIAENVEGQGNPPGSSNHTSKNQTATETATTSHRPMPPSSAEPTKSPRVNGQTPLSSEPIPRTSSNDVNMTSPMGASQALGSRSMVAVKRKQAPSDLINHEVDGPLQQGTSTLEEYLLMADRLMADLPPLPTSALTESRFTERFVVGLANCEERKTIIRVLRQQEDLWTRLAPGSGREEEIILIRWEDFKEAVKRSKLLEVTHGIDCSAPAKELELGKASEKGNNDENVVETKKQDTGPKQKKKKRTLL